MILSHIEADGTEARLLSQPVRISTGTRGAQVAFSFGESWAGLHKTAVFSAGEVSRDVLIDDDGTAVIPTELLKESGVQLYAGVYGCDDGGNVVIPTTFAAIGYVTAGTSAAADAGAQPELPFWAQVQARVDALVDGLKAITAKAVTLPAGSQATAEYTKGQVVYGIPRGEKGEKGRDGYSPLIDVTKVVGGNRVVITDKEKVTSFYVMDGINTAGSAQVDEALSESSRYPVENRAVAAALAGKVDKQAGKQLSANDFTDAEKEKLSHAALDSDIALLHTLAKYNRENLLDNSCFYEPVNQRGRNDYSAGTGYTIDRWYASSVSGFVRSGYVAVQASAAGGFFGQKLEAGITAHLMGKELTAAVGLANGQVYSGTLTLAQSTNIRFDTGTVGWKINILVDGEGRLNYRILNATNSGENLQLAWAALYEGAYAPGDLPAYRAKGYAAEFAACSRYFQRIQGSASLEIGVSDAISPTEIFPGLKIAPMRAIPAVSVSDLSKLFITRVGANSGSTASTVSVHGWSANGTATLRITTSDLTSGTFYRIVLGAGESINLSADL